MQLREESLVWVVILLLLNEYHLAVLEARVVDFVTPNGFRPGGLAKALSIKA